MAVMQLRGESAEPCAPRLSCWEGVWPGAATAQARPGRPAPHGPSCPPPARCLCPPPLGPWGHPAAPAGSAPALAGGAGQEASSSALPRAGTALAAPRWVPPHSAPSALPLTQPGRRDAAWIRTPPTPLCRQRHTSPRGSEPPQAASQAGPDRRPGLSQGAFFVLGLTPAQSHRAVPSDRSWCRGPCSPPPPRGSYGRNRPGPLVADPGAKPHLPCSAVPLTPRARDPRMLRREVSGAGGGAPAANASHWCLMDSGDRRICPDSGPPCTRIVRSGFAGKEAREASRSDLRCPARGDRC